MNKTEQKTVKEALELAEKYIGDKGLTNDNWKVYQAIRKALKALADNEIEPEDNDWIMHGGYHQPVSDGVMVECRVRGVGGNLRSPAEILDWLNYADKPSEHDIIAYRIIEKEPKKEDHIAEVRKKVTDLVFIVAGLRFVKRKIPFGVRNFKIEKVLQACDGDAWYDVPEVDEGLED